MEEVVGAAVERRRGHDVVASFGNVLNRDRVRGRARGQEERCNATLKSGNAVLDRALGGVANAGVDRAEVLQGKSCGRHLGGAELERGGLVNRQRACAGRRVRGLTCVNLLGFELPIGGHVCWAPMGNRDGYGVKLFRIPALPRSWRMSPPVPRP